MPVGHWLRFGRYEQLKINKHMMGSVSFKHINFFFGFSLSLAYFSYIFA
jgi:hypothetical protein